jgi:(S)-2-hydroxyglutarate dehydrogenase
LRRPAAKQLAEFEPHVSGIARLRVPETGAIDHRRVARSFAGDVRASGGDVLLGHEVLSIGRRGSRFAVATAAGEVEARKVLCCAGLYSDRIRFAEASDDGEIRIVPFRRTTTT